MPKRLRLIWGLIVLNLILALFFLTGCTTKPYLTQQNTYNIITVTSSGSPLVTPVKLPWNANMAVMQKLLLESSFVLSDLHTPTPAEIPQENEPATMLQAIFPESKQMTLTVDHETLIIDVQSIEIEVEGQHIGRVMINKTWALQGIEDPNLEPAFQDFHQMLQLIK